MVEQKISINLSINIADYYNITGEQNNNNNSNRDSAREDQAWL